MPEYLAPGVYVEEVSFRSKSIEGVSTSTAGFIGPTRYGPVDGVPELLTSYGDFQRIYGGIDRLKFENETDETENYMAHAVRAFFDNGGSRLYVARTYTPAKENDPFSGRAALATGSPAAFNLRARFPGRAGNMLVTLRAIGTTNLMSGQAPNQMVRTAADSDVVYVHSKSGGTIQGFYDVVGDGAGMLLRRPGSADVKRTDLVPGTHTVHLITFSVRVLKPGMFEDEQVWDGLSPHPDNRNAMVKLFTETPDSRDRYLNIPFAIETAITSGAELAEALVSSAARNALNLALMSDAELAGLTSPPGTVTRPRPADLETVYTLTGGSDGNLPAPQTYEGREASRDTVTGALIESSGLGSFELLDDISIVAAPGSSFRYGSGSVGENEARWLAIAGELITHCQIRMRYRVALLDSPNDFVLSEIRDYRGQLDSTHAALYYPWIIVNDPLDPNGKREIAVPPSGYVAGICARTDVLHGVFKAPANEVVMGALSFEKLLNKAQQDVLNPEGINCFRFFEGRGYRLWGARTISSDPEWKYLSVRRYFAYLEHSLDRGTQWAVFENNNEALWANITTTCEDFLRSEWRSGALLGTKEEDAFFVRCDRSTMSQNDLDNGRLIVLIGVAVVKPAEYVIIRIGQKTADTAS